MKSIRTLFITIPAVTLIAGLVGFIITYPSSEQVAFARVFIDLGVMISLLCATWTIPKPAALRTGEIADALRDLVRGRYDKRLPDKDLGALNEIALAFNELAGSLSDSRDLDASFLRYKNIKDETPQRPIRDENFSHHPELGPVKPLPLRAENFAAEQQAKETKRLNESVLGASSKKEAAEKVDIAEVFVFDAQGLYQRFQDAHLGQKSGVDFDVFRSMIERTRLDLLASHGCKDVRFDVVTEGGEIALQPRLIR